MASFGTSDDKVTRTATVNIASTPKNDRDHIIDLLERMKEKIWIRRPILGEIMKKHGNETLSEYVQDFFDINPTPQLERRRHELIEVAKELIAERLGSKVAVEVVKQLEKFPLVSTADHHGPVTHPFFFNSNIISAIPYAGFSANDFRYLISFSFASISVNNTSFPRGITFHGKDNGAGSFIRLPILPDRLKMATVYGAPNFTQEDIAKTKNQLEIKKKTGELSEFRADKIADIIQNFFATPDILSATDFASQITKINYRLWPAVFNFDNKMPNLIYLDIETLVVKILERHHLYNTESLLHKVLFDLEYQKKIAHFFNNLPGGFSLEDGWGTYMFWAMDEKLHRVRLILKDGFLVCADGDHRFEFTPESIGEALKNKKIFPGMLLSYLVVSLYYGMKCLGGFSQVNDLTMLKEAWGKLLESIGMEKEKIAFAPVQTKELGGDGMVLSYMGNLEEGLAPATAIDLMLESNHGQFSHFIKLSKQITLAEAMSPLLPDIYNVLYSSSERDPDFAVLVSENILQAFGLDRRLLEE